MIRNLRIRFIRIAMFAVILVLFLIIGAINILNYQNVVNSADSLLEILSTNDSRFPGMDPYRQDPPLREYEDDDGDQDPDDEDVWIREMENWNRSLSVRTGGRGRFSEETPFESRYFSASVDEDGQLREYDISHIAAVSGEEELQSFTDTILASSRTSGFFQEYRFLVTEQDGEKTILFLDCSRSLASFRSFLLLSIIVSILGLTGILILIILLSGRIVRPVQESYEKQKRFITDAGHELKTPLTIIDADIMVAEMETGENEWLNDIKVQTKRLSELTGDLIYLSRMDEGSARLQMIDFPFSDMLSDTVQSFRSRAQTGGKTLVSDIEPLVTCCGDENSLRKLASILLDNAVKYARDKGTISVSLKKTGRAIQLIVENDVDAVDPEMLRHMFERFYRADASRNSEQGGHGIGLSIAQAVTAAHKGTITAEAASADRLRITVNLPV